MDQGPKTPHADAPDQVNYPPAPWHLRGRMTVSLWRVRRSFWATAWAVYEPAGVLAYRELLTAKLVGVSRWPRVTIPLIWVDHPVSIAGGRQLWAIPKEPARFEITEADGTLTASATTSEGRPIARCRYRRRRTLPGRWSFGLRTRQPPLDGSTGADMIETDARLQAELNLGIGEWEIASDGPLAFLADRTPWLSLDTADLALVFGHPSSGVSGGRARHR